MTVHASEQIDLVRVDDGEVPEEELQKIEEAVQTATDAKETAEAAEDGVKEINKRIVIDDDSVDILDADGHTLASYGTEMVLGQQGKMQLTASNDGMRFGLDGMSSFWLNPKGMITEVITSDKAFSPSDILPYGGGTDLNTTWPAFKIHNVEDAAGHNWTNLALSHQRYPIVAVPADKSEIVFPVTVSYIIGGTFMEEEAAGEIIGRFDAYEHVTTRKHLSLGSLIVPGILSSSGGRLIFSIPTGRVFDESDFIRSINFEIVVRASNANGAGLYIIKSSSGGSSAAVFDYVSNKTYSNSDPLMTFYDGANNKRTPSLKPTIELQGGTNILFDWATNTNYYFSGNSSNNGNVNNNACTVWLTNIEIEIVYGGMQPL